MRGLTARGLTAAAALVLGAAFSFAMSRWEMPYMYPWDNKNEGWLLATIPFAGLALLVGAGLRRSSALVGLVVLAALTVVDFTAAAHSWAGYNTGSAAKGLQVVYGLIVLAHLAGYERGEAQTPLRARRRTALVLAIALVLFTVFTAVASVRAWNTDSRNALEIGVAFAAPFWLSTVFALYQLARGKAKWRAAAYLWFGAAFVGLNVLFFIAGMSNIRIE